MAAFNLVSTLVMTVTDKQADIAILRTLGLTPRGVMQVFMVQGSQTALANGRGRLDERVGDRGQVVSHDRDR